MAAAMLATTPAFADDDDAPPPDDVPAPATPPPPASAPPAPAPPPPPRVADPAPGPPSTPKPVDAETDFEHLARPPSAPVPVPNPSPVVVGGRPTPPGRFVRPLEWRRARYSKLDFGVTIVGGSLTLAAAIVSPRSTTGVTGPVLFDKPLIDFLQAPTLQQAYVYRDASDVGLSLLVTWPFFVDALITAWWYRGSRDTAEQMTLIGLETMAISGALQGVTNVAVGRERPYGDTCGEPGGVPDNAHACTGSTHYRSFFSGHSSFAFTGASLVCFQHVELKLLGGPWDALSCLGGYAVAATTATFRVAGLQHYPTDILTGAILGTAVGWGVPLLHSRKPQFGTIKTNGGLTMRVIPTGVGAGVVGTF